MKNRSGVGLVTHPDVIGAQQLGQAIRDLRRQAHLSQGDLAAALGMCQGPVCNIEKGRNFPSTPVLVKIARVLKVSVDELLAPCAARSPGSLDVGVTAFDAASPALLPGLHPTAVTPSLASVLPLGARIVSLARDYLALEDICRVPRQARLPFDISFDLDLGAVPRLARQVRECLGVGSAVVFDYVELFENHGLRVCFTSLLGQAESLSLYDAQHSNVFIFIDEGKTSEKHLFRLFYELGRVLIYVRAVRLGLAPYRDDAARNKLARRFAAECLMPEDAVFDSVHQIGVRPDEWDLILLLRLKHRFGVSAETFNYRLLELGLIAAVRQAELRQAIKAHYATHDDAEPGQTRRILSPNGRLGDLLHTALIRSEPEAAEIATRLGKLKINVDRDSQETAYDN